MNKGQIANNIYWAMLGKVVNLLGSLFVGIVVARYLGPEQYGLMNYVISYVALFQIVATFGLDNIEIREEAKGAFDYRTVLGTSFRIKLVLAFATLAACICTSLCIEAESSTVLLVAVYSLSMIANSFGVMRNYFMAIVQNEYVVKSEIARTCIGAAIKVMLLFLDVGLVWFIVAAMFDAFLVASGYCLSYRSKIGSISEWGFDKDCAVYLVREAFPLLLTSAAVIIYQRIDQVMIGRMIDNKSVGYFSVAARFADILLYIPQIILQTLVPVMIDYYKRDIAVYLQRSQQLMNLTVWLTFVAAAIVSALSYWLVVLLFGEAYMPAVVILQILVFKAVAVALSSVAGNMIIVEEKQKLVIIRDIVGCTVCVCLNLLLLPRYGVVAAAFVAIASNAAAGWLSDAFIPAYRGIFVRQTKAVLFGWRDLANVKMLLKR